jgi:hypothetical protein
VQPGNQRGPTEEREILTAAHKREEEGRRKGMSLFFFEAPGTPEITHKSLYQQVG